MEVKEEIFKEAFDLIMKYGVRSVTMDDIAQHCGVSKKTIYQFIDNKEQLINELLHNHLISERVTMQSMAENAESALEEMILLARHIVKIFRSMKPSLVFDLQKYYPSLWKKVEDENLTFMFSTIRNNIIRGKSEKLYLKKINEDIIARVYVHMLLSMTDEDIFPLDKFSRTELLQSLIMYHIRGIISDKGRATLNQLEIE